MSGDIYILELYIYIYKETPIKQEGRNRTRVADRIFAVWFSKKIGSVQFVFNLKKKYFSLLVKSFDGQLYFK